ncbi:cholesterol esterase [Mortierella polycephala]|uniref:Cholesterol esterase n=1 Tax=Mortierella polycephala TaxID=41804 RepID=A0A9P6Q5W8_9FUNG|nr:cholesterol esterase [Mortierella polycephala]
MDRRQQEEDLEVDLNRTKKVHRKEGEYIKPVVLLYHGFMMCSEVWLCNLDEERSLAFILAEAGYDVWLGNARGNKYSLKHMFLKPHEKKFWDFSMDELALFDMPDTVNYILNRTGAPSLVYIGFSQGTAQAFASLSINPDLNSKVSLFIALAPATTPPGLDNGLVNAIVKAAPNVIYLLLGRKTPLTAALFWQNILHPATYATMIDLAVKFLFGWKSQSMSRVQKAVSYQHLYSFTSVRILVHWFQIIRTQTFQMYDDVQPRVPYLSSMKSHCPHPFPTNQISTPIAIFYGGNDSLVNIKGLLSDLPELVGVWEVHNYEHLDFLWAEGLDEHVYPHIMQLLETHSFNGHTSKSESKKRIVKRMGTNGNGTHVRMPQKDVHELGGYRGIYKADEGDNAPILTPYRSSVVERLPIISRTSSSSPTHVHGFIEGQDQQERG